MKRLVLGSVLLAATTVVGCVQTTSSDVGVVEEYTRPSDAPIVRPRSTEARRALEAEWPPATAWEPPPEGVLRIRPVYRPCPAPPSCRPVRPQPADSCRRRRRWRRRHDRRRCRVYDASGTEAVILRVRRTGRDSPPVIRLTREDG